MNSLIILKRAACCGSPALVVLGFLSCGGCATQRAYHHAYGSLCEDRIETIQSACIISNTLTIVASGVFGGRQVDPLVLGYPLPPVSIHASCTGGTEVIYIAREGIPHASPPTTYDACHVVTHSFTNRGIRIDGWIIREMSVEHGRTFDVFPHTVVRVNCCEEPGHALWMSVQPAYQYRGQAVPLLPVAAAVDSAMIAAIGIVGAFGGAVALPSGYDNVDVWRDRLWIPSQYH